MNPSTVTSTPPPKMPPPAPPSVGAHDAAPDAPVSGIPAYGTLIQVLSSTSPEAYTTIANAGDITGPANSIGEVDVTSHSSGAPIKQTLPGLIDLGDLSFPCFWNPEDPTQKISSPYGIEFLFYNRKTTKFQLVMPNDTHRTRQFRGFVKTMGEDYKVAGVCTRNIAIRIVSPLVDVPSPINTEPVNNLTVPHAGNPSNTFSVKAGGSATPWTAIPSDTWITITSPTDPQTGDGDVTYGVAAMTASGTRSGSVTITGLNLTFPITQLAT